MKQKIVYLVFGFFIVVVFFATILCVQATSITMKKRVFTFEQGDTIPTDPLYYVNATSDMVKDITLNIKDVKSVPGIYDGSVSYKNFSNNKIYDFKIHVLQHELPDISVKNKKVNYKTGQKITAKDLINEDLGEEYKIYFLDEDTNEKVESITYKEAGSYIKKILAEDSYGNDTATIRVVIEVTDKDTVVPVIHGVEDTTIKVGDKFDPLKGVYGDNGKKKKKYKKIKMTLKNITKNTVDTSKAGTYEVDYQLGVKGVYTYATRIITVEEK